jgi:hypothetical protein
MTDTMFDRETMQARLQARLTALWTMCLPAQRSSYMAHGTAVGNEDIPSVDPADRAAWDAAYEQAGGGGETSDGRWVDIAYPAPAPGEPRDGFLLRQHEGVSWSGEYYVVRDGLERVSFLLDQGDVMMLVGDEVAMFDASEMGLYSPPLEEQARVPGPRTQTGER